jgi:dienelactone hydrolase
LLLLLGLGLTARSTAAARQADSGTFRLYQGMTEVGWESFWRDAEGFRQEVVIPGLNLRLRSQSTRTSDGAFSRLELTQANGAGDSLRAEYSAERAGDSVRVTLRRGEATSQHTVKGDFDGLLPPQSVAAFVDLVQLSSGHDRSFRLLVVGPDTVMPTSVRWLGDTARVEFAGLEIRELLDHGQAIEVTVPMQQVRAVRGPPTDSLVSRAATGRPMPDYSAPPGAAFRASEVRVPVVSATDSFSLGCTLTLPGSGRRPFPAAITITGSGGQTRDSELWPLLRGYRPFRQIAERLTAVGIAVLRCDDRATGSSTGRLDSATTADLAGDTRAQLSWLRARPEIDPGRIALVGHSEGGMIGPMIATEDPRVAAVVIMAGPAKPGTEVLVDQARWPVETAPGLSDSVRRERLEAVEQAVRSDSAPGRPWMAWFRRYDPLVTARRLRTPTLILQGALDRQVTAGQADSLAAAIRMAPNRDVTVRVFPRLNHLFLETPGDGSPSEYPTLPAVEVPAAVLDTLAGWLRERLSAGH